MKELERTVSEIQHITYSANLEKMAKRISAAVSDQRYLNESVLIQILNVGSSERQCRDSSLVESGQSVGDQMWNW